MTNRTALAGLVVVGTLVVACSRQAPAPAPVVDDGAAANVVAAQPVPATPTYDSATMARMATGMLVMIEAAPQCQTFRDQLQAIANATAGSQPAVDPSEIVARANEAGCAKKYGR